MKHDDNPQSKTVDSEETTSALSCEASTLEESQEAIASLNEEENQVTTEGKLEIKVSLSLYRKLHDKARKEKLSVEELASELLSEGIVLRAWEIMERKSAMKGSSSSAPSNNRNSRPNNYNSRNNYQQKGKYNRSGGSSSGGSGGQFQKKYKYCQEEMSDSANFIEYVRSQEKNKPW